MKKHVALFLAVLMMAAALFGCSTSTEPAANEEAAEAPKEEAAEAPKEEPAQAETQEAAADPSKPLAGKVIGNTIVYKGDVWCALLAEEFEKQAAALGAEISVEDGDLNSETQSKQIENMLARNVDVVFADPATFDGCNAAFEKTVAADIPLFTFDSQSSFDGVISHTGWDNTETGRMVGEYVLDWVKNNMPADKLPAKIILLGHKTSEHCNLREVAFEKIVDANPDVLQIISRQDCEGNREKGANAITNIVEPFDIVASVVDNGAWGAVSAIEARGLDAKVFCMGAYGDEPFQALRDNHPIYKACLIVDPAAIAQITLENYVKYVNGETGFEPVTNIPLYVCDTNNIADFYSFPNG